MIFSVLSFIIINLSEGNELKWVIDNSNVSSIGNIIYFFIQIYYSTNFGDIAPLGYSRILVCMEMISSVIIHVILLGRAIGLLTLKLMTNR